MRGGGIKDEVQASVSASTEEEMRGGHKGIVNWQQDVDLKLSAVAESGDDLQSLGVCGDLHVSNSLEFLGNSDWKDDVASRALYDTRKLQKGFEISMSMVVENESYIIDGRPSLIGTGLKRLEVTSSGRSE